MELIGKEEFITNFAQDASAEQANAIYEHVVPEPTVIGDGVLDFAREEFEVRLTNYIATAQDRIIGFDSQKRLLERVHFDTQFSVNAGHLAMITAPADVADIIAEIFHR